MPEPGLAPLRAPSRTTLRWRLTLVYGAVAVTVGLLLLVLSLVLVERALSVDFANSRGVGVQLPSGQRLTFDAFQAQLRGQAMSRLLSQGLLALALLGAIRSSAQIFGCEARRFQVVQGLTERLTTYADMALEAVNAGDVIDEVGGIERIETCAHFLELIDAKDAARTVRRRVAVAGGPRVAPGTASAAA